MLKMTHRTRVGVVRAMMLTGAAALLLSACGNSKDQAPAASTAPSVSPKASAPASTNPSPSADGQAKSWTKAPEMAIDVNKKYTANVQTNKGNFTIELFAKEAPKTVNNFVFLSKQGFFENITFHRIIEPFMIQTGDPKGNGTGGPGYKFEDELNNGFQYEPGIVAMANSGKNTNGSQFFICTGEGSKSLNQTPNYSIFGKVVEGMDTVTKIAKTPVKMNPQSRDTNPSLPTEQVVIQKVTITEK